MTDTSMNGRLDAAALAAFDPSKRLGESIPLMRAAIIAELAEPSEGMLRAGNQYDGQVWRAMIQHIRDGGS